MVKAVLNDNHVPAGGIGDRLDAAEDFGEAWIRSIRNHKANCFGAAGSEASRNTVRRVTHFVSDLEDALARRRLRGFPIVAAQHARDRRRIYASGKRHILQACRFRRFR